MTSSGKANLQKYTGTTNWWYVYLHSFTWRVSLQSIRYRGPSKVQVYVPVWFPLHRTTEQQWHRTSVWILRHCIHRSTYGVIVIGPVSRLGFMCSTWVTVGAMRRPPDNTKD
jgi:hypothetical protein